MPRTTPVMTNFTAGELSPRLRARVNWEKYPNAVAELQNFIIMPHGPIVKRPGSRFVAEVKDSSKATRVVPFRFSTTQTYILEFGHLYVRFYSERGRVVDGSGNPIQVTTVYPSTVLTNLKFLQSADVLFIFHPDYSPRKLSRYSHTSWLFSEAEFRNGPFMPVNATETTITPSAKTGTVILTMSGGGAGELVENGTFETPGDVELVTNGSFDGSSSWTVGGYWSINNNSAVRISYFPYGPADVTPVEQDIGLSVVDVYYRVEFTLSSCSAGSVAMVLGDATGTYHSVVGTYVEYLRPTATGNLKITPDFLFSGSVTSVSVKSVTADVVWTWGTGWSLDTANRTAKHTAGNTALLEQEIDVDDGDTVRVTFTMSGRTAGSVTCYINNVTVGILQANVKEIYHAVVDGVGPFNVQFLPSSNFNGSLDSISVQKVGAIPGFQSAHVGSLWRLQHQTGTTIVYMSCGNPCLVGAYAHGLKDGDKIIIMGMHTFGSWPSLNGLTFSVSVAGPDHFWIPYDTTSFSGSPYVMNLGYFIKKYGGYAKITAVSSQYKATAEVIESFSDVTPTQDWAESAWSDYRGWPAVAAFHDERLLCAATRGQPQTIWGSVVGDYFNMLLDVEDDDAFSYTIASGELETIQWMASLEVILLGTASKVMRFSSTNWDDPITPTNFQIKPSVHYGTCGTPALVTGEVVLYLDRQRRRIRELAYNFEKGNTGGYVSQDMTLLSEHITKSGILSMTLEANPDQVAWCQRSDGILTGLTYERPQSVIGWHRHITDGQIESVAIIPGDVADELWMVVKRTIGGATKRYVEFIDLDDVPDVLADCFFVDSGLSYSGVPANEMDGLDHLEGKTVKVLADGTVHPDRVVTAGRIVLNAEYSKVHAGLPYECRIKTLPIEAGAAEGSAQGKIKRFHQVGLMLEKTLDMVMGDDEHWEPVPDSWADQTIIAPFPGGFDVYGQMIFEQNSPTPVIIKGIAPRIVTSDA